MPRKKIIVSILAVVIWMVGIFVFSEMKGDTSNGLSIGIVEQITSTSIIASNKLNYIFRKAMHATEYCVLSILIYNILSIFQFKRWKCYVLAILLCFLYACTDEFHQLFVNGRTSQLKDVLIDSGGACIGVLILYTLHKIRQKVLPKQEKVDILNDVKNKEV